MQDEPPFSASLTAQLAALQRKELAEAIVKMASEVSTISQTLARQDERLISTEHTLVKITEDLSEVKSVLNRYKGGIAVILGLSGFIIGVVSMWDSIVKRFH